MASCNRGVFTGGKARRTLKKGSRGRENCLSSAHPARRCAASAETCSKKLGSRCRRARASTDFSKPKCGLAFCDIGHILLGAARMSDDNDNGNMTAELFKQAMHDIASSCRALLVASPEGGAELADILTAYQFKEILENH